MNQNNERYNNSGPIAAQRKGISPTKVIFIILMFFVAMLAYKTYKKIAGFLSFVSGEIDAVSSTVQHSVFSTSGPIPLDDEDEDGMIINDNPENNDNVSEEDEGDEATREELPRQDEEKGGDSPIANVSNSSVSDVSEAIEAAKNNVSANKSTENNIPPVPFPRKLNPFEKSFLGESDDTSSGGNYQAVKLNYGYFNGYSKLTLRNSLGTTQFIHKDNEIFQYVFFPSAEKFADVGMEIDRRNIVIETFSMLYDQVHGDGQYEKNKNNIRSKFFEFVSVCSSYKGRQWHFTSIDGYSYGCNQYGFTVLSDQAADMPGTISGMEAIKIFPGRNKFSARFHRIHQQQQNNNAKTGK